MKFLSVCSGIEAASVAWKELGWKAIGFSEIEKFPSELLAHHYPDVPNFGDMTLLADRILDGEIEAPDLLCGGTPCQAFSVAGRRESLDDERGNLTLIFCEIADAIDRVKSISQQEPGIIFWENVPGVLNTKDNAFGCFLGQLAGEDSELQPPGGKWKNAGLVVGPKRTIAWRILDAQYFGVAQRRRRVFVVASAREGFNPAEILFECEGLRRDTAPSRSARKTITADAQSSTGTSDNQGNAVVTQQFASGKDIVPTLMANCGTKLWSGNQEAFSGDYHIVTMAHGQAGAEIAYERSPTLTCVHEAPIVTYPTVYEPVTYGLPGNWIGRKPENGGNAVEPMRDLAPCLNATDEHAVAYSIQGNMIGREVKNGPQGTGINEEVSFTLNTVDIHGVATQFTIRRLTPTECERLQGFPDGYTKINDKAADSHRYKALGNSWAVPVVRWIGKRIHLAIKGYPVEVLDDPLFL